MLGIVPKNLPEPPNPDPRPESGIEAIVRVEKESRDHRSRAECISDAVSRFAGSEFFILMHVVWFTVWITMNGKVFPGVKVFDPYPFNFLTMIVSLEAILLTAFVMISQNRMSRQADKRAHLDLQVNLLAEAELTKALQILDKISKRLGVHEADSEARKMMERTDLASLANEIDRQLTNEP